MPADRAPTLDLPLPCIMGVLNVTPDSFSDGGRYLETATAVAHGRRLAADGAGIIDIGGESTRPGAGSVSASLESSRVLPVVEELHGLVEVALSIDTSKADVARRALAAGATMVNDVSALRADSEMVDVVAEAGCAVCLMHMQGAPRTMQQEPSYDDVVGEVLAFLDERLAFAVAHGIREEQVLLDPGIGFGKTLEHNLLLIKHLDRFAALGRPLVLGTSRKRFLGAVLGAEPDQRTIGTVATTVIGLLKGAAIFRVHDVKPNVEALRVVQAVRAVGEPGEAGA
jgi:dihydropteroate synthase